MYWHQARVRRNRRDRLTLTALTVLAASSLALSAVLTTRAWPLAFYTMPPRFWELGSGMILCLSMEGWRPRLQAASPGLQRAATGLSLALIAIAFGPFTDSHFPFPMAVLPVAGTIGLIALVSAGAGGSVRAALASSPMTAIGRRSYSLYLWHFPIFVLFRWTAGLDRWSLDALALGLTVGLAEISYRFVERPFRGHRGFAHHGHGRIVAAGLLVLAAGAATSVALTKVRSGLSLSVTADHEGWYAEETRALAPSPGRCDLVKDAGTVEDGEVSIWTPVGCGFTPPPGRLFVIGDSHALAYNPMLRQFAAGTGVALHVYFASGCPFLDLRQTLATHPACTRYFAAAIAQLEQQLRPGDVLFLPSLRLQRQTQQWGGQATEVGDPEPGGPAVVAEARAILARLTARGAHIVFELPLPIFRSPPFRCSDWFNRSNPICAPGLTMPTGALSELRAPIVRAIADLVREVPHVTTWDPFPTLCGPQTCAALSADGPLFFDVDHISGHGNDRLFPSFSATMTPFFEPSASSVPPQ
jgi:hypothetical protein